MRTHSAITTIGITMVMTLGCLSFASAISTKSAVADLCASTPGPSFIISDESRKTIAVHAGQLPGVSFLSLETGQSKGHIHITEPILAASMSGAAGVLVLALSEGTRIRISNFDVANRKLTSTAVFGALPGQSAIFAPNGKYLFGITQTGDVFKIDLVSKKVDVIKGAGVNAASLAASSSSSRLYVAGSGLAVIDIDRMSVVSTLSRENKLLEVAVSPDDHKLVIRNWHNIEIFDLTKPMNDQVLATALVDPLPDGISVGSVRRLAFTSDGSGLYYMRGSQTGSELISMSTNDLHIDTRSAVGPYARAIAIASDRRWILLATGFSGQEQFEAIEMKTHNVIFKTALPEASSAPSKGITGCPSRPNAS